jgi:N-acetylglucosamine-6-sulfatase
VCFETGGFSENTVVVFMSDNGHLLGEHRAHAKATEYEESVNVPLRIRDPTAASKRESKLVSNVDIASTLTDVAGVTPTIPEDGRSLVPVLDGSATRWRSEVLLEWLGETAPEKESQAPPYWAIRTRRYKYVELNTGERELYDLLADPYELNNVAGQSQYSGSRFIWRRGWPT